jgi:hypothetical protein
LIGLGSASSFSRTRFPPSSTSIASSLAVILLFSHLKISSTISTLNFFSSGLAAWTNASLFSELATCGT